MVTRSEVREAMTGILLQSGDETRALDLHGWKVR